MSKWHDTTRCISCGYEITGLRRNQQKEIQCPECAHHANPEAERTRRLAEIRQRDRRQFRVLTFLAVLFVALVAVTIGLLAFVGSF